MKLSKMGLELCAQACINSYRGEYGDVIPVFYFQQDYDIGKVEWSIGIKDGIMYVVFRGSDGKADWIDNIDYEQIPYELDPNIKLHRGFYKDQFCLAEEKVISSITQKLIPGITNIIITGHSLGGGLAELCAFSLKKKYNFTQDLTCIALAPPRVGNKAFFKKLYEVCDVLAFRYKNDTVTQVPMKVILFFRHKMIGKIKLYYPVILRYGAPNITRIGRIKWYEKVLIRTTNPFDHYPKKYKKGIQEMK